MRTNTSNFSVRQVIVFIVSLWCIGLFAELVLIGHYEGWLQYTPLIILGVCVTAHWLTSPIVVLKVISFLIILVGLVGVGLHLKNNWEFELEMYPHLSGWNLLQESLTGALPVLAPGALIPIGLLGLLIIRLKTEKENE